MLINRKNILLVIIFFLCFQFLSAQKFNKNLNGVELCDYVYNYLKDNKLSPQSQSLLSSGTNQFPYNILLNFYSLNNNSKNLVLNFPIEEFEYSKNIIIELASFIEKNHFPFDTTILLSYGDSPKLSKSNMIFGSEIFINSLSSTKDYSAIIVNCNEKENSISANNSSYISPLWLLKTAYKSFKEEGISSNLPSNYLCHFYKQDVSIVKKTMELFMENKVQTIELNFDNKQATVNNILNILKNCISEYADKETLEWDQHTLMFSILNKNIWISETDLIKIVIFTCFIVLFLVYIYTIYHNNVAKKIIALIRGNWFIGIFILLGTITQLSVGKTLFLLFDNYLNLQNHFFYLLTFQITLLFLFIIDFYYIENIFNKNLITKGIDFQCCIFSLLNILLFSLIDLTLFPLFLINFIIFMISYYSKNNYFRSILLVISLLSYFPYLNSLLSLSQISKLENYLLNRPQIILCISFILTPDFLLLFRILFSHSKKNEQKMYYLNSFIYLIVLIILLFISFYVQDKSKKQKSETLNYTISTNNDDNFDIFYSDELVFGDIVRTISINMEKQPVTCSVTVNSSHSPVLYSYNDFVQNNLNSATFITTHYPPKELSFSYGTQSTDSTISVTVIFEDENRENNFILQKKSINIE